MALVAVLVAVLAAVLAAVLVAVLVATPVAAPDLYSGLQRKIKDEVVRTLRVQSKIEIYIPDKVNFCGFQCSFCYVYLVSLTCSRHFWFRGNRRGGDKSCFDKTIHTFFINYFYPIRKKKQTKK